MADEGYVLFLSYAGKLVHGLLFRVCRLFFTLNRLSRRLMRPSPDAAPHQLPYMVHLCPFLAFYTAEQQAYVRSRCVPPALAYRPATARSPLGQ